MSSATAAVRAARRAEVREALNTIDDPCSIAARMPIGLVDMGIVQTIRVAGDRVYVSVRPTFPGCLYLGLFAQRIGEVLGGLPWCRDVDVALAEDAGAWDESKMAPHALRKLEHVRALRAAPRAR